MGAPATPPTAARTPVMPPRKALSPKKLSRLVPIAKPMMVPVPAPIPKPARVERVRWASLTLWIPARG